MRKLKENVGLTSMISFFSQSKIEGNINARIIAHIQIMSMQIR